MTVYLAASDATSGNFEHSITGHGVGFALLSYRHMNYDLIGGTWRVSIGRGTTGGTPTNQAAEKANSRSPAADSTFATADGGDPGYIANELLIMTIRNAAGGPVFYRSWHPPRPRYPFMFDNAERLRTAFNDTNVTRSAGLTYAEPADGVRLGRRIARRGRRNGHYALYGRGGFTAQGTANTRNPSSSDDFAYVQVLDWPETVRRWEILLFGGAGVVNAVRTASDDVFSLLNDSTARLIVAKRAPSDSVSAQLADTMARLANIGRAATDSIFSQLVDSAARQATMKRAATDSVSAQLADSAARAIAAKRPMVENVSAQLNDSVVRSWGSHIAASDSVFAQLADSAVGIRLFLRSASDTVFAQLADTAARGIAATRSLAENVSGQLNDSPARAIVAKRANADDVSAQLADVPATVRQVARTATVADSIFSQLTDSVARIIGAKRAPSDTVFAQLADSTTRRASIGRSIVESVAGFLADVVTAIKTVFGAPTNEAVAIRLDGSLTTAMHLEGSITASLQMDGSLETSTHLEGSL